MRGLRGCCSRLTAWVWSNLGSCPYCIRSAFRAAMLSWVLVGLVQAMAVSRPLGDVAIIAACTLTALWLTHLLVYASRVCTGTPCSRQTASYHGALSRREMLPIFVRALGATAIATSIPSLAWAECDQAAAERCQSDVANCRTHCERIFHRDEAIHSCRQECASNLAVCRTEAKCS